MYTIVTMCSVSLLSFSVNYSNIFHSEVEIDKSTLDTVLLIQDSNIRTSWQTRTYVIVS